MNTLVIPLALFCLTAIIQKEHRQTKRMVEKKGMTVSWQHSNERIYFEMTAPTTGWVTVGFNETQALDGAYLIMARVYGSQTEVVEHKVISPGDYRPITNSIPSLADIAGAEYPSRSWIRFSLPIISKATDGKDLEKGKKISMILAYSTSDDFQHHSIMRTAVWVSL